MTLCVESNFVLELALGQRHAEAVKLILDFAQNGAVELAIPTTALFEPFTRVMRQRGKRRELRNRVNDEIDVLKRSQPHQLDVQRLATVQDLFVSIEDREKKRLDETVRRLIAFATIIEVDAEVYQEAFAFERDFGFEKMTDAIICAAILKHLSRADRQGSHMFATLDKDFRSDDIVERFARADCVVAFSFEECVQRLRIRPSA